MLFKLPWRRKCERPIWILKEIYYINPCRFWLMMMMV